MSLLIAHKEWAPTRKVDPDGSMNALRADVEACRKELRGGGTTVYKPGDRNLSRGDRGPDVAWLQRFLNIPDDGSYGPQTEAAVRDYQAARGLTVDGKCGPQTWASVLGEDDMPTAKEIVNELLQRRINDGGKGGTYTVEAYLVQTNLKVSRLVGQVREIVREAAEAGGTPDEIAERVAQRLAADPPKDEDPA